MYQKISWLGSTFLKPGKAQNQDVVQHITPIKQQIVIFTRQLLCKLNKPDSNDVTSTQSSQASQQPGIISYIQRNPRGTLHSVWSHSHRWVLNVSAASSL